MRELIEFMARAIVDNPDAVEVSEEDAGDHIVFHLKVAEDDMGRVIGKQGRIANAMRTLLKVAAIRRGERAVLEIGEPAAQVSRPSAILWTRSLPGNGAIPDGFVAIARVLGAWGLRGELKAEAMGPPEVLSCGRQVTV